MHFNLSSQNFVRQADTTSGILLSKAVGFVYYDDVVNQAHVSISSGQRNLMKSYYNDANTSGITKIALKNFLDFFGQ